GNRLPKGHLSPHLRGKIAGAFSAGAKVGAIAKAHNLGRTTINYTLKQDALRNEGTTLPKAPRRKSYVPGEERKLIRHVKKYPKDSYDDIIEACALRCEVSTVKKILKRHGMTNCKAR
ncbi:hypothetical protein DL98DRAFT_385452, partial [Cadophora sp. DSE1049]